MPSTSLICRAWPGRWPAPAAPGRATGSPRTRKWTLPSGLSVRRCRRLGPRRGRPRQDGHWRPKMPGGPSSRSLVADSGITQVSWLGELRGWFEGFVEGLASGPPAVPWNSWRRWCVRAWCTLPAPTPFSGPQVTASSRSARPGLPTSPWERRVSGGGAGPGQPMCKSAPRRCWQTCSPTAWPVRASCSPRRRTVVTSGLDVSAPPYRPLDGTGGPVEGLYVLGLQLSSVQWGTAIAAEAGASTAAATARSVDADAIAADILG